MTEDFGRSVHFGRTAGDYRAFRAGFPPEFFAELSRRGIAVAGRRALDLGTGTGAVARGLAAMGMDVTGLDPAKPMLVEAAALDREAGIVVEYRVGHAEATALPDAAFDLVTAGQCWHWFDRVAAAMEVRRLLAPGSRVVIAHFDWLPLGDNVVEATEYLIKSFNPRWSMDGGTGIYPQWLADLTGAGFSDLQTFSFDVDQAYTHEAWRGRIRASAGVKATLGKRQVAEFDRLLAERLVEQFPAEPMSVPHRVWAVIGTRQ